jgi:hypothetical protein
VRKKELDSQLKGLGSFIETKIKPRNDMDGIKNIRHKKRVPEGTNNKKNVNFILNEYGGKVNGKAAEKWIRLFSFGCRHRPR